MFLISGPSLLYVFKKWSEFTLKVVRVYIKSGPSLLVFLLTNILLTIVTYAPCKHEYEIFKNIFYEQLRTAIEQVLSYNCLIILNDMNLRMGPEDVQCTYNTSTNNNEVYRL